MIDFERALLLIQTAEKAMGHPQLKFIVDAAQKELAEMEPKPAPVEEPEPEEPPLPLEGEPIVNRRV